jgi:hypothetical protein
MKVLLRKVRPFELPLALFLVLEVTELAARFVLALLTDSPFGIGPEALGSVPPVLPMLGAIGLGIYRVAATHPVLKPGYREWLTRTPWMRGRPLPLGPIHLGAKDFVLGAIIMALIWPIHGAASLALPKVFAIAYLLVLMFALALTLEAPAAYLAAFGLGGLVLAWSNNWSFVGIAALSYAATMWGVWRSLGRFPWSFDVGILRATQGPRDWRVARPSARLLNSLEGRMGLGWPFDQLSPKNPPFSISCLHGLAISASVAWCFFAATSMFPLVDAGNEQMRLELVFYRIMLFYTALFPVALRIRAYRLTERLPPTSLSYRLRTGHLIVPSYDRVWVAPLLMIYVIWEGPVVLADWGLSYSAAAAASLGLAVLVAICIGPSRRAWALTGNFRLRPGFGVRPPSMV